MNWGRPWAGRDSEIAEALLLRLAEKNYIPQKARDQYGQALVREFKRSLGLEINEPAFQGLTIRVLGLGCTNCQTLFNRVMEVLNELNLTADLEHVTDVKKIACLWDHGKSGPVDKRESRLGRAGTQ